MQVYGLIVMSIMGIGCCSGGGVGWALIVSRLFLPTCQSALEQDTEPQIELPMCVFMGKM